jgi:hypothetical protein
MSSHGSDEVGASTGSDENVFAIQKNQNGKMPKILNSKKVGAQSSSDEGDEATSMRNNDQVTESLRSKEERASTGSDENVRAPLKSEYVYAPKCVGKFISEPLFRQEFEVINKIEKDYLRDTMVCLFES